jgi:hypothetical protein
MHQKKRLFHASQLSLDKPRSILQLFYSLELFYSNEIFSLRQLNGNTLTGPAASLHLGGARAGKSIVARRNTPLACAP